MIFKAVPLNLALAGVAADEDEHHNELDEGDEDLREDDLDTRAS